MFGSGSVKQQLRQLTMFLTYAYAAFYIAVGADKFLNFVTFWPKYFSLTILNLVPMSSNLFIMLIGILEICIGVLTIMRPKLGAQLMTAWFGIVIVNFLTMGMLYLDIAVRDAIMAMGTWTLACLIDIEERA